MRRCRTSGEFAVNPAAPKRPDTLRVLCAPIWRGGIRPQDNVSKTRGFVFRFWFRQEPSGSVKRCLGVIQGSQTQAGVKRLSARNDVPIVDSNAARRARIARELNSPSKHAEMCKGVEELLDRGPIHGSQLIGEELGDAGETLQEVSSQANRIATAFYSEHLSPQQIVNAMLSGALDYLEWPFAPETIDRSVERLERESEMARLRRRKAEARKLVAMLTPREHDVLEGLLAGQSNKAVAKKLGLSLRTVEIHRTNMLNRLNAQSTSDAVRLAIYAGLGDQPGIG